MKKVLQKYKETKVRAFTYIIVYLINMEWCRFQTFKKRLFNRKLHRAPLNVLNLFQLNSLVDTLEYVVIRFEGVIIQMIRVL